MSALGMAILPIRITALAQSDGNGRTAPPQSWIQKLGTQVLIPRAAIIIKACIGTVKGDMHDIGKNLVRMMIEGKGIEIIDLGVDVDPQDFVKCAIENDCSIICCSALLTTTMPMLGEVVKAAEEAGIRDKVTIMVGGAPVNQAFADSINADIYTEDAASAADAAAAVFEG